MIEKSPPGDFSSSFSNSVENFENIRTKSSALEFHLFFNINCFKRLRQKLRRLQIADFEQSWDFSRFPIFAFFTYSFFAIFLLDQLPKSTKAMDIIGFRKWSDVFKISAQ